MTPSYFSPEGWCDKYAPMTAKYDREKFCEMSNVHIAISNLNFIFDRAMRSDNPVYRFSDMDRIIAREIIPFISLGRKMGLDLFLSMYSVYGIDKIDLSEEELKYRVKPYFEACYTDADHETVISEAIYAAYLPGYRAIHLAVSVHDSINDCADKTDKMRSLLTYNSDFILSDNFRTPKPNKLHDDLIVPEINQAIDLLANRKDSCDSLPLDTPTGAMLNIVLKGVLPDSWIFEKFRD